MKSHDLYELLIGRLDDLSPVFLGEFTNRAALPRRRPPLYAWVDRSGDLHIDTNRAAITRKCVHEAVRAGCPVNFGDPEVEQAVSHFVDLAETAASSTLRNHAAALARLKSARWRAAVHWRIAG